MIPSRFAHLFVILLSLSGAFSLLAQVPTGYVTQEEGLPCLDKRFSLRVHLIDAPQGIEVPFDTAAFEAMLALANDAFAPICLSFENCEYLRIENYRYTSAENRDSTELVNQYGDPNRIDLFITNTDSSMTCGYATQGGVRLEPEAQILLTGECIDSTSAELTHLLGHYFGLYNTYETRFGEEQVNGENCETTGDLVCDTPADPFEEGTTTRYTGPMNPCLFVFTGRDNAGQFYVPHVANAMSMYSDECGCGLTLGQLERVARICQEAAGDLW